MYRIKRWFSDWKFDLKCKRSVKTLKCAECGSQCTKKEIYEYPQIHENQPPQQICLCYDHVKDYGFCGYCGNFFGGVESFEFNNSRMFCDDCMDVLNHDLGNDDFDDEYLDYYEEGDLDAIDLEDSIQRNTSKIPDIPESD